MSLDYEEVEEAAVAPWRRELAAKVLALVSREMLAREKVPPPEIQWVSIRSLTCTGFTRPALPHWIYIDVRTTREELILAVVHELVHVLQAYTTGATELSEWAASGIAAIYVRRFLEGG